MTDSRILKKSQLLWNNTEIEYENCNCKRKGGTGKTTVSLNLALALSDVQLFDCDVEEPNCNLFLGFELEKVEDVVCSGACNQSGKM